jgi:hypothetical protein
MQGNGNAKKRDGRGLGLDEALDDEQRNEHAEGLDAVVDEAEFALRG